MEKVVLTRGRYEDNFILNFLTMEVLRSITICCHKGEYRFYNENFKGLLKILKKTKYCSLKIIYLYLLGGCILGLAIKIAANYIN